MKICLKTLFKIRITSRAPQKPESWYNCSCDTNSPSTKLEIPTQLINADFLVITETKLHISFTDGQFRILGFGATFHRDHNKNESGIVFHKRRQRGFCKLKMSIIEHLPIKIGLPKKKYLLNCSYNPNRNNISDHCQR